MSHAPVMPLFPDALLGGTLRLTTEQFGAYCLILFATWANNGKPLPDDERVLARTCRCTRSKWRQNFRPAVIGFFDLRDGLLHQKRLEKEWEFVQGLKKIRQEIGKRGGNASALKRKDRHQPIGQPNEEPIGAPLVNQPKPEPKKESRESLVINTQSPRARTRAREAPVPDLDTRPSLKKFKKDQEGEDWLDLGEPPEGWIAEAEAARDDAGLPAVNLRLEWAKFAARAEGEVELRRWIEWALRAWVQREQRQNDGTPAAEAALPDTPWANRMRAWREDGFWLPSFGPKPGEAGCFVPPQYLEAAE